MLDCADVVLFMGPCLLLGIATGFILGVNWAQERNRRETEAIMQEVRNAGSCHL